MLKICKLALPVALLIAFSVSPSAADESLPFIGDVTNGTNLYRMNCAVCHGFDGSGNGPAASTLKTKPADHRDGSLMNARDNQMIYRVIHLGCKGAGCRGAMPPFGDSLDQLDTWDLVAYLRSLHLPITAFFPEVDQYLVKRYTIGKMGNRDFKEGQMERLKEVLKKVDPADLPQTIFTMFRSHRRRPSPELVPQEPRRLAQLHKGNKIGYVFFMMLVGPRGKKIPVGLSLDTNYTITKLVATIAGMGKRGDLPEFAISRDKVGKIFDKAAIRVYMLAVEAANSYELEEKERSWADGTF